MHLSPTLLCAAGLFVAASCSTSSAQSLYIPPAHTVALPARHGDGYLRAGMGKAGLLAQFARALDGRMILTGMVQRRDITQAPNKGLSVNGVNICRVQIAAGAGVGLYGHFKGKSDFLWSVVAGYDLGQASEAHQGGMASLYVAPVHRLYLLPSIGYVGKRGEFSFSMAYSNHLVGTVTDRSQPTVGPTLSAFTVEPIFGGSIGGQRLRVFAQLSTASVDFFNQNNLSWEDVRLMLNTYINFSAGLHFSLRAKQPPAPGR
ncbi:MAG TPA: hypothetical protein PK971_06210 [Saprospiraceae bacterium]|nr:hypothetical protein [Saprospiraceae bacterium]HND87897.1 hypothetical protein [Saprospiraceae bacterium]